MKVNMSTTKLNVLQEICEKFNGTEQYIKELKCFVAKANYQQKRSLICLRIIRALLKS